MKHDFHIPQRPFDSRAIHEVAFDELDPALEMVEVAAMAGAEIIKDSHTIAAFHEGRRDVRTDEARPAGY
jgi:hypothetical protein